MWGMRKVLISQYPTFVSHRIRLPCDPSLCVRTFSTSIATGCILDSVVSEVSPATVLELGTYCGYSTVRIASRLPPHAKLITLEFNPEFAVIARQVIAWAGVEDKVKPGASTQTENQSFS